MECWFYRTGLNKNYLTTCFGWQRHIKNLFQFKDGKKIDFIKLNELAYPITNLKYFFASF